MRLADEAEPQFARIAEDQGQDTIGVALERVALVCALGSLLTNLLGSTYGPDLPLVFVALAIYLRVSRQRRE